MMSTNHKFVGLQVWCHCCHTCFPYSPIPATRIRNQSISDF